MLYTMDSLEGYADQNASIYQTDDEDDLDRIYRNYYSAPQWTEADFGDCWVKVYSKPELDENGYTEFYDSETRLTILCSVRNPGQHPGGKAWWLNPVDPVMIPVIGD